MAVSKYAFWERYHVRKHLYINHHCLWENLVNMKPPAEALIKNSFLLDKSFPYLNSGLVSSPLRLVLCHEVWEGSSLQAEEESLDDCPSCCCFSGWSPQCLSSSSLPGGQRGPRCLMRRCGQ